MQIGYVACNHERGLKGAQWEMWGEMKIRKGVKGGISRNTIILPLKKKKRNPLHNLYHE